MYRIKIVPDAVEELQAMPAFYRRCVEDAIDEQLIYEPQRASKNRICLESLVAGFEYEPPLWELRVGEWRVFYDVGEGRLVTIRTIREKPPSKTTKEIV